MYAVISKPELSLQYSIGYVEILPCPFSAWDCWVDPGTQSPQTDHFQQQVALCGSRRVDPSRVEPVGAMT